MVMPKMGESITDGTVIKWLKQPGETVEKDEIVLEISTDKVDSEIPTPVAGKIVELLAEENETVDVGVPIAIIETDNKIVLEKASSKVKPDIEEPAEQKTEKKKSSPMQPLSLEEKPSTKFFSPFFKRGEEPRPALTPVPMASRDNFTSVWPSCTISDA